MNNNFSKRYANYKKNKKDNENESGQNNSNSNTINFAKRYSDYQLGQSVDENFINAFVSDTDSFIKSAQEDSKRTLYGQDATNQYNARQTEYDRLSRNSSKIRSYYDYAYKTGRVSKENYDSVTSYLDQFSKDTSHLIDAYKSSSDYYSQFEDADSEHRYAIGWNNPDATTTTENAKGRQDYYNSNKKKIEELDSKIDAAVKAIPIEARIMNPWSTKTPYIKELEAERDRLKAENKKYERGQKTVDDSFNLTQNPDFEENSTSKVQNPTRQAFDDYERAVDTANYWSQNALRYNNASIPTMPVVRDKLGLYLNASDSEKAGANADLKSGNRSSSYNGYLSEGVQKRWEELEDNEIAIYYYKLNTEGQESAYKFLDDMEVELGRRQNEKFTEDFANKSVLEKIAYNVATFPAQAVGGILSTVDNAINLVRNGDINPYSYLNSAANFSSNVRGETAREINEATGNLALPWIGTTFGDVYQSLMSAGDSIIGGLTFGSGYSSIMGLGAASQEAKRLYEQGASPSQMMTGGFLAGAAETVFEYLSLEHFLKPDTIRNFGGFVKAVLSQAGVEGSEEAFTEISNVITNALVMGSQSDLSQYIQSYMADGDSETKAYGKAILYNVLPEVINSAVGGFISGGAMGMSSAGTQGLAYNSEARETGADIVNKGNLTDLIDRTQALEDSEANNKLKAIADKVSGVNTEELSNRQRKKFDKRVGDLYDRVTEAQAEEISNVSTKAIANRLRENLESEKAKGLPDRTLSDKGYTKVANIIKKAMTETLSANEGATFEKYGGKQILNELLNDKKAQKQISEEESGKIASYRDTVILPYAETNVETETVAKEGLNKVEPYDINADGKTILTTGKDSAEDVNIESISSNENGNLKVRLDDGRVVRASDISFATEGEALAYETVASLGTDTETSNKVLKAMLRENVSSPVQINEAKLAYLYGETGQQSMLDSITTIPSELRSTLYTIGESAKNAKALARQSKIDNARENSKNVGRRNGKVVYEADTSNLSSVQRESLKGIETIAAATGATIHIFDSKKSGMKGTNGWFDANDSSIHIDINAGQKYEGTMMFTLGHEMTHFIRMWSPQKFQTFADFLFDSYGKNGINTEALIQRQIQKAKADGRIIDRDTAYEEVVADSCMEFLMDDSAYEKLQNLKQTDKSLFDKIVEFLKDILDTIKEVYKNFRGDSREARLVKDNLASVRDKLQNLYNEALSNAVESFNAIESEGEANEVLSSESIRGTVDGFAVKDASGISGTDVKKILYSTTTEFEEFPKMVMNLSNVKNSKLFSLDKKLNQVQTFTVRDIRSMVMRDNGFSSRQINGFDKFMNTMANFMEEAGVKYRFIGLKDVKNAKLHYSYNTDGTIKSIVLSAMVKNGDYPVNFDFTSICKKRVAMSNLIGTLARKGYIDNGIVSLTKENIFKINQALKEEGFETACLGCFVESKRYNIQKWAESFIEKWNKAVLELNKKAEYFNFVNGDTSFDDMTIKQLEDLDDSLLKFQMKNGLLAKNALKKDYKEKLDNGEAVFWDKKNNKPKGLSDTQRKKLNASVEVDEWLKEKALADPNSLNYEELEILIDAGIFTRATSNAQKIKSLVNSSVEFQKLLRVSDLITPEGITQLQMLPNMIGVLYGHYGSGTPKLMQGFTPYNSEIALLADKKGEQTLSEYLYSIAGARMQSFSDFQIQNVYDYLQMIGDLSARKLPAHAYTKEISFAKLFGMTGAKINLSVMFDIDPENEKFFREVLAEEYKKKGKKTNSEAFEKEVRRMAEEYGGLTRYNPEVHKGEYGRVVLKDDYGEWVYNIGDYAMQKAYDNYYKANGIAKDKRFLQSIGFENAIELQTTKGYTKNTGIIAVGYSKKQIELLLKDDRIRYVIPYHKSSLPKEISTATHIGNIDFTNLQNNMKIKSIKDRDGDEITDPELKKKDKYGNDIKPFDLKKMAKEVGAINAIKYLNKMVSEGEWKVETKKAQNGHGSYKLYEKLQEIGDPKATIEDFFNWCTGNNTLPLFYEFAGMDGYYKLIYDFNVYDNVTGEYAPQGAVTNTYPVADGIAGNANSSAFNTKYFEDTVEKYMKGQDENNQRLEGKIDEIVNEKFVNKKKLKDFDASNPFGYDSRIKRSSRDSEGNELSKAQQEYFKDSKVRDEDGNLLKVYHGTDAEFTVFDRTKGRSNADIQGMFFSPWDIEAGGYGGNVKSYYLNITNPASESMGYKALSRFKGQNNAGIKAREYLISLGYDGVANYDEYVAFYPEQIKLTTNTTPTSNEDIRYSSRATMTSERIDYLIDDSGAGMRKDYARSWITSINPTDFLNMTLGRENQNRDRFDSMPGEYGSTVNDYDFVEGLKKNMRQTPYLAIDYKTGEVVGHEGRHRMRALEKQGITSAEIRIEFRDEDGYVIKELNGYGNPLEKIGTKAIYNQRGTGQSTVLRDILPLNKAFRDEIVKTYGDEDAALRYSTRDTDELEAMEKANAVLTKQNAKYRDDIESLKELLKMQGKETKGKVMSRSSLEAIAKKLIKENGAKGDYKEFAQILREPYQYLTDGEVIWEEMKDKFEPALRWLRKNEAEIKQYRTAEADEMLKELRTSKVRLTPGQRAEVESIYGSYNNFRKMMFGKIIISDKATSDLESLWSELASRYAGYFDPETTEGDMPSELLSGIESMQNSYDYVGTAQEALDDADIIQSLYDGFWDVSLVHTVADKKQREINLLKAKHSEQMDALRQQRDEKIAELKREQAQRIREVSRQRIEARDRQIQKLKDRYAQSRENAKERRNKSYLKSRIKKIAEDFRQRLAGNSDTRYIPKSLVSGVVEVYNLIDPTGKDQNTKAAERYRTGRDALIALRDAYEELRTDAEYDYASEYSEEFSSAIKQLAEAVGDTPLRDMTLEQLQDVHDIISDISFMVKYATKQIGIDESITNYEAGQEVIDLMRDIALRGLTTGKTEDFFRNWTENPMRAVREMSAYRSDSRLVKIFEQLNEGRRKADEFRMMSNKKFDEFRNDKEGKKNFDKAVQEASIELTDIDDYIVHITPMQGMTALLTFQREMSNPNRSHLDTPVRFLDPELALKGKYKEAVDNGFEVRLDENTITQIFNGLSEWDKAYMQTAREFFNGEAQNAINETSLITKHRIIATEKDYIPYIVNTDYVARDSENVKFDASIEGMGMLKSVQQNAKQQLYMYGLNEVLDSHIDKVAKVYGLSIPVRNWNKLFNMKQTSAEGGKSVQSEIRKTWKSGGVEILDRAVADLQSPRRTDSVKALSTVKSAFVQSTLASNISVWMKQAASYPTAGAILSGKSLAKGLARYPRVKSSDIWNEIDEHTSQHWIRRQGLSMQELGEINQSKGWENRLNQKLGKASPMNWIQAMDVATTAALWLATKEEVKSRGIAEGSDEFWNEVTKLYDKVIEDTQPMYDPLHRAEITKNKALSNIIMFQTQPIQNSGILREGTMNYKMAKKQYGKNSAEAKEAFGKFRKAVTSQLASHFVFTSMTLLAAALMHKMNPYRDDDEELTAESVIAEFAKQFGTNFFGAVLPVFGNYAISTVEAIFGGSGYAVLSDATVDKLNGSIDKLSKLKSKPTIENTIDVFAEVASYFGIPAANAKNIIKGGILHIQDIINGEFLSFESGVDRKMGQDINRAYTAFTKGDSAKSKSIINELVQDKVDGGKTEKEAKSAIRSSLTSKYKPLYLEALESKNNEKIIEIRKFLHSTGIYGSLAELDKALAEWRKKK